MMFFYKIKRLLNIVKYSPRYYIFKTKKYERVFFFEKSLTKFEKRINNASSIKNIVLTDKQKKSLFIRFLKENNIYQDFKLFNSFFNINFNEYIINNTYFILPLRKLITNYNTYFYLKQYKTFVNILEVKWPNFLHNIGYNGNTLSK